MKVRVQNIQNSSSEQNLYWIKTTLKCTLLFIFQTDRCSELYKFCLYCYMKLHCQKSVSINCQFKIFLRSNFGHETVDKVSLDSLLNRNLLNNFDTC